MSISTQSYKGARDFYPTDKRFQKWLFSQWRQVCESFGYEEYDAPILEPTELYLMKGSQEIVNEQTYSFVDRGGRNVTLRTEMTPSVSRMVAAKRQELAYPLRWYSIPGLWRYERMQRGRGREFWQLNVDLFGVDGIQAEHEIISIADALLKKCGAKPEMYQIKLNSRKLTDYMLLEKLQLSDVQASTVRRLIDKKDKIAPSEFLALLDAALTPSQRQQGVVRYIADYLETKDLNNISDELKQTDAFERIQKLLVSLSAAGIKNAIFDASLMRGFDYYTDVVFEVFDTYPDNNRSMFGGGRYDGLVAQFGVEAVATVGFGMGDLTFANFLEAHQLMPTLAVETEIYALILTENFDKALRPISELREMGVTVATDFDIQRKIDKRIKNAIKKDIPYVLFLGDEELNEELFTIKDLAKSKESKHSLQRIVSIVKDYRKK